VRVSQALLAQDKLPLKALRGRKPVRRALQQLLMAGAHPGTGTA
jgi:hypothetical protein